MEERRPPLPPRMPSVMADVYYACYDEQRGFGANCESR